MPVTTLEDLRRTPFLEACCRMTPWFKTFIQDPWILELIFKPREAQRIIDFDALLKGCRRGLEGVLKGSSADKYDVM